jgi:hypothetical protein
VLGAQASPPACYQHEVSWHPGQSQRPCSNAKLIGTRAGGTPAVPGIKYEDRSDWKWCDGAAGGVEG